LKEDLVKIHFIDGDNSRK